MRALILSDIHANLEALSAVIDDASSRGGFDVLWCLGDLVGYGPDQGPCLTLVRSHSFVAVAGNHDYASVGKMSVDAFNYAAKAASNWTTGQLSQSEVDFLSGLPLVANHEPFTMVHGSLRDPLEEYLLDADAAEASLKLLATRFLLVGHSHFPFLCLENQSTPQFVEFTEDAVLPLTEERWIINPGSTGQPRDRDPRSSYAIYDDQNVTIERHRVEYDIESTQNKMREAELPEYLIERLKFGI